MLSTSAIMGLLVFVALMSAGQMLFKLAAQRGPALTRWQDVPLLLQEPLFWVALLPYATATVLWLYLLQQVPLSRAYPFSALAFVVVPLLAAALFGEVLSLRLMLGCGMILLGVWLVGTGPG